MSTEITSVAVVSSAVDSTSIGATTPSTGRFTTPGGSDNSTNAATTAWCLLGFAVSLGASGYIKLPGWLGGLVIQWGSANAGSSSLSVTFPMAFPNACWSLVTTSDDFGPNSSRTNVYNSNRSTTGFTVGSDGSTIAIDWIAVGN